MLQDSKITAFLLVVDQGTFSAAATAAGVTQPAISAKISALESSLGVDLFRRGRGLRLTPEGETFLGYARRIQADYDLVNSAFPNVFSK